MFTDLLRIIQESQVVRGLISRLCPQSRYSSLTTWQSSAKSLSPSCRSEATRSLAKRDLTLLGFCGELGLKVSLKVEETELVLGVGEELFYDLG